MHLRAVHRRIIIEHAGVLPALSCCGPGLRANVGKMADTAF
jgi:hypothetical protein